MKGVDIFPTGVHRDKPWTIREIDAAIKNFERFSSGPNPIHEVPDVIGHDEADLEGTTDKPASGWYRRLYKELQPCGLCKGRGKGCERCWGTGKQWMLKGDLEEIPAAAQKKFDSGEHPHTSAEFYPSPASLGLPGEGPVLRRVAALGGEPPEVKGMPRRPPVEKYSEWPTSRMHAICVGRNGNLFCFSEGRPMPTGAANAAMWSQVDAVASRKNDGGYSQRDMKGDWHHRYAEGEPMDRAAMLAKLQAAGVDTAKITDAIPDDVLADMCRLADGPAPDPAAITDDQLATADPATMPPEEKKKFAEHCASRASQYGEHAKKFGEGSPVNALTAQGKDTMTADKFSELAKPLIAAAVAEVRKEFASVREQASQLEANTKRSNVEKFCEAMAKDGKILPAELDRGDAKNPRPTILDRLLRADARTVVHKFSEGGKQVELSELDLQMREIERRPTLLRFNERQVKQALANGKQPDPAVEVITETVEKFSEYFPKGETTESMSKGYAAFKKHNPKASVEDFLGDLVR